MRPQRELLHMITAAMWGRRSVCSQPNRKIGCVITTEDMKRVLSIGYNGPAKGLPNNYCAVRMASATNASSRCPCLHAEDNAIAMVDGTLPNKVAFITFSPCETCAQRLIQANVTRVFYDQEYRIMDGVRLLESHNVEVNRLILPEAIRNFVATL